MYRIHLTKVKNKHEYDEFIKIFLRPSEYMLICGDENIEATTMENVDKDIIIMDPDFMAEIPDNKPIDKDTKNRIKRYLYDKLSVYTGISSDWGILNGIRPVKVTSELISKEGSADKAKKILLDYYYLSNEKAELLLSLCENQARILGPSPENAVSIYIGIPFCPTRCVYCSFTSNQVKEEQIKEYLKALHKEISFVAENMELNGWYPETIYIGGGTPTTISAEDLKELLLHINSSFNLSRLREFTVEAGRPDTITLEKLQIIKDSGAERISINPQSMSSETLKKIGRAHEPEDIIRAFKQAKSVGIPIINADIIAGLPDEDENDFSHTLSTVIGLEPENITVHTLALKRASRLKEIDSDYNYHQGKKVGEMLRIAKDMLAKSGYLPYYLYRQKQMTGNFENIGYAKPDTAGIYNIRIMEEKQTIIALGAGGMSKVYYPEENRLERVANVSNYEIYIERLDEMLQRKSDNLFKIGG